VRWFWYKRFAGLLKFKLAISNGTYHNKGMKIKEYIAALQKIADKYPDADTVYSCDDEGNRFSHVHFTPTVGNFNGDEFYSKKDAKEQGLAINAVCIN
jgi:hypothetical protein